jgi:hypothetical protein
MHSFHIQTTGDLVTLTTRSIKIPFVPIALLLCLTLATTPIEAQDGSTPEPIQNLDVLLVDEAPVPADPAERANREAKNARYNSQTSNKDLTAQRYHYMEISCGFTVSGFGESPLPPNSTQDVIVLGSLVEEQPYLSANRTALYTEYTFEIEENFKPSPYDLSFVEGRLIVDRPGGTLRLQNGKVVSYGVQGPGMARPLDVGHRYVLFCRFVHGGKDLMLGPAFELRDGQAYALGESRNHDRLVGDRRHTPPSLSTEEGFLKALRDEMEHPRGPKYLTAPQQPLP